MNDKYKFDKCCKTAAKLHQIIGECRNFAVIPSTSKGEPQLRNYEDRRIQISHSRRYSGHFARKETIQSFC
jgi:hypothetical protein